MGYGAPRGDEGDPVDRDRIHADVATVHPAPEEPLLLPLYDGFYAALCVVLLAAMRLGHHQPLIQAWDPRYLLLLPFVCHAQILCSVFIHNCTHNNFPRVVNRLVGEICGVVVLTRFASWEVIHQRHHRYSDDTGKDPHPRRVELLGLPLQDDRERGAAAPADPTSTSTATRRRTGATSSSART